MTPVDTATGTAGKPIPVPGMAESIAISPDGRSVYVGSFSRGKLTTISTSTNQVSPIVMRARSAPSWWSPGPDRPGPRSPGLPA